MIPIFVGFERGVSQYAESADASALPFFERHSEQYLTALSRVVLVDPRRRERRAYVAEGRRPLVADGKPSIAASVAGYLSSAYPEAWRYDLTPEAYAARPAAVRITFVGFGVHDFVDALMTECSLPAHGASPLPPLMYRDHHWDVSKLVACYIDTDWSLVIRARRPVVPAEAEAYDALVAGWAGPGLNAFRDVDLAVVWSHQFGLTASSLAETEG